MARTGRRPGKRSTRALILEVARRRFAAAGYSATSLRAIAAALPADRIMVETDAPYLAPLPYRGKRNEPAYVAETAKVLADTRGVSVDEIAQQTTENFFRLFNKVPRTLANAA